MEVQINKNQIAEYLKCLLVLKNNLVENFWISYVEPKNTNKNKSKNKIGCEFSISISDCQTIAINTEINNIERMLLEYKSKIEKNNLIYISKFSTINNIKIT